MDINLNGNSKNPYDNVNQNNRLIALTPYIDIKDISNTHVFLVNTETEKTIVIEKNVLPILPLISIFDTKDNHIENIIKELKLDKNQYQIVKNLIEQLNATGFIIDDINILKKIKTTNNSILQEPPKVVIRTMNRVSMLKRLLISAKNNEDLFNSKYHYFVLDDSDEIRSEANRKNCKESGLDITYINNEHKEKIIEKIKLRNPGKTNVCDFLLGNHKIHTPEHKKNIGLYGRNWNLGILLTAGHATVMLDDDCLLHLLANPFAYERDTIDISLKKSAKSIKFLKKTTNPLEGAPIIKKDPIAILAEYIGSSISTFIKDDKKYLKGAENNIYRNIEKDSQLILNTLGVFGDPGSASNRWLFALEKDSNNGLLGKNKADYENHKVERFGYTGFSNTRIYFDSLHSTVTRGFDNRILMPPTLPIFRNEDFLFTNLLNFLYPSKFNMEQPYGIPHLPEIERKWHDKELDTPLKVAIPDLLSAILKDGQAQIRGERSQIEDSLNLASRLFFNTANISEGAFKRILYKEQQEMRANHINQLQKVLDDNDDAPEYFKEDIIRQIQANTKPDQSLNLKDHDCKHFQEVIKMFAKSLSSWQDLWEDAKNQHDDKNPIWKV